MFSEIGFGKFENWRFDIENNQFFSLQNQLFQKFYHGQDPGKIEQENMNIKDFSIIFLK